MDGLVKRPSMFYECTRLKNIVIPTSVASIGDRAFFGCESLTNIGIPSSVTSIGHSAFWGCKALENIEIPHSVRSIGFTAFRGCQSVTKIVIPPSVSSIGNEAFRGCGCTSQRNIVFIFNNCETMMNVVIPPSVAELGDDIFSECHTLRSIEITYPRATEESFEPNLLQQAIRAMTPNSMEEWVKTRAQDGRITLCTAAAVSLKWKNMKRIFKANMVAIYERDVVTGLSPFMLAAVGLNSDIESVYRLSREYPDPVAVAAAVLKIECSNSKD